MSDMFYRAFEEQHRGSFELIQSRLNVYLPFIQPLKTLNKIPLALDLGCGRGEWLDLLQQNGFAAKGIDLNDGMLQECRVRNLDAIQGDVIAYLRDQPSNSLNLISAFHLVEHIPFDVLRELTEQAYRVLKPGGLMILETPNPENIQVGTSSFYLDPTHQQPLPSLLLSFIVEYAKFERVKPIFLQEPYELCTIQNIGVEHILEGVSYDYAIVSQKEAEHSILAAFNKPFARDYGTRLMRVAQAYDKQTQAWQSMAKNNENTTNDLCARIRHLEATVAINQQKTAQLQIELHKKMTFTASLETPPHLTQPTVTETFIDQQKIEKLNIKLTMMSKHNHQLQSKAQSKSNIDDVSLLVEQHTIEKLNSELQITNDHNNQLQAHSQWLQNELDMARQQINTLHQSSHHWWTMADNLNKKKQVTIKLEQLLSSITNKIKSGKLTAATSWFKRQTKRIIKGILRRALSNYALKDFLSKLLIRHPGLKQRLRQIALRTGMMQVAGTMPQRSHSNPINSQTRDRSWNRAEQSTLSPRANRIYIALQDAIENKDKIHENSH
jgi:SAM-dependent methyltransferase